MRNGYEIRVGKFKRAVDPQTASFREFPTWIHSHLLPRMHAQRHHEATDSECRVHEVESSKGGSQPTLTAEQGSSAASTAPHGDAAVPASHEGGDGTNRQCSPGREDEDDDGGSGSPVRVAMYCTGGIRCEKATAYLVQQGVKEVSCAFACSMQSSYYSCHSTVALGPLQLDAPRSCLMTTLLSCQVYHLDGGILNYLKEIPPSESLWEGECFVFDKRVTVKPGLLTGSYSLCYACKEPVSDDDMTSPLWENGVSCPYCYHRKSNEEKARARARQEQVERWGDVGGPKGEKREHAEQRVKKRMEKRLESWKSI